MLLNNYNYLKMNPIKYHFTHKVDVLNAHLLQKRRKKKKNIDNNNNKKVDVIKFPSNFIILFSLTFLARNLQN